MQKFGQRSWSGHHFTLDVVLLRIPLERDRRFRLNVTADSGGA